MPLFLPTDEQWWKMCDCHMSDAVELSTADINRPFVYQRDVGLFYVPFGMHHAAMSLLYAFHHGYKDAIDAAEGLGISYIDNHLSDAFLETIPGTCYLTGVILKSAERSIVTQNSRSLNAVERRIFGQHHRFKYIET